MSDPLRQRNAGEPFPRDHRTLNAVFAEARKSRDSTAPFQPPRDTVESYSTGRIVNNSGSALNRFDILTIDDLLFGYDSVGDEIENENELKNNPTFVGVTPVAGKQPVVLLEPVKNGNKEVPEKRY